MTRKQYRLQTLIRSESRAFAESAAGAGKTGRPPADCAGACPLPQDLSEKSGWNREPLAPRIDHRGASLFFTRVSGQNLYQTGGMQLCLSLSRTAAAVNTPTARRRLPLRSPSARVLPKRPCPVPSTVRTATLSVRSTATTRSNSTPSRMRTGAGRTVTPRRTCSRRRSSACIRTSSSPSVPRSRTASTMILT